MSSTIAINLTTTRGLETAIKAYQTISSLSESEIETLEILSNQKENDLILQSVKESKNNKTEPIESIL